MGDGLNILKDQDENKNFGMYRGVVVDDEDPRDIGRVKLSVPGIFHEKIPLDHLPWAIPALGLSRGGGDNPKDVEESGEKLSHGYNFTGTGGVFTVPARGNHVWLWFDGGNHMNPVYFAMAPGEKDWLEQKKYIKEKLSAKLDQIKKLQKNFVNGGPSSGQGWAGKAFVDARQGLTTKGDGIDGALSDTISVEDKIKNASDFKSRLLNSDSTDKTGEGNMKTPIARAYGTGMTLDVKNLLDADDGEIKEYHFDKIDGGGDAGKNINRFITSFTTYGGTTVIVDNRDGQENYFLIHKNYLENIDQEGSRKIFIGTNVDGEDSTTESNQRANDELAVAGDKKVHVYGEYVVYSKGNTLFQSDQNTQIDVNHSMGVRVKKGDLDIILDGDVESFGEERDSSGKNGKEGQEQSINICVKKGSVRIDAAKSIKMHAVEDMDIQVDRNFRLNVKGTTNIISNGRYSQQCNKGAGYTYRSGLEGNAYDVKSYGNQKISVEDGGMYELTVAKSVSVQAGGRMALAASAPVSINSPTGSMHFDDINGIDIFDQRGVLITGGGTRDMSPCWMAVGFSGVEVCAPKMTVNTQQVVMGGTLDVSRTIKSGGDVKASRASLNSHKHTYVDTYQGTGRQQAPLYPQSTGPAKIAITPPKVTGVLGIPAPASVGSIGGQKAILPIATDVDEALA